MNDVKLMRPNRRDASERTQPNSALSSAASARMSRARHWAGAGSPINHSDLLEFMGNQIPHAELGLGDDATMTALRHRAAFGPSALMKRQKMHRWRASEVRRPPRTETSGGAFWLLSVVKMIPNSGGIRLRDHERRQFATKVLHRQPVDLRKVKAAFAIRQDTRPQSRGTDGTAKDERTIRPVGPGRIPRRENDPDGRGLLPPQRRTSA